MAKEKVSFDDTSTICEALSEMIKADGFKPDIIIGVARGGWVPARLMSDQLDVMRLASIGVSSYDKDKKKGRPKIVAELGVNISGLEVLVVDDITDTGESLEVLDAYLQPMGPKRVKYVTLHCKPWATRVPDYFFEKTDAWKDYAWEKKESSNQ